MLHVDSHNAGLIHTSRLSVAPVVPYGAMVPNVATMLLVPPVPKRAPAARAGTRTQTVKVESVAAIAFTDEAPFT